eukprot:scaffold1709_cov74-Skeletonema_dohrnii-CCMP3373.AAC.2
MQDSDVMKETTNQDHSMILGFLNTGACSSEKSIGGFVLLRIIGHYDDEHRNAIMVDAGATALTKEKYTSGKCKSENGVKPFPFQEFPLGSTVLLIPNHSCLAAACFEEYHVVDGGNNSVSMKSEVVEM